MYVIFEKGSPMSIHFRIKKKKDPRDLSAPPKYYAVQVSTGLDTLQDLARAAMDKTAFTEADFWGVMKFLQTEIKERLKMGRSIDIGFLILRTLISSSGRIRRKRSARASISGASR